MRISTLLLDTSALNPGRIRYPKSRRESHPLLWGPRVNTCEVSGLTVSQRDRQLAIEAISELFIMDKLTAARCQNTMTIIDQRLFRGPLTVEAFKDKGSGLELFIQGHSVHELLDSHYVLYKPPGVSGFEQSTLEGPCFRSFLPYASMPFGYISPIERSSSGLLILLNDIRIRNHLERGSMPRRYSVRVAGNNPVHPVMIAKINQAIWLRKLTVTPRELSQAERPVEAPAGSAYEFSVSTTDIGPHVVRTMFGSVGVELSECKLEAIGRLSLESFGLETPGQVSKVSRDEILRLLS